MKIQKTIFLLLVLVWNPLFGQSIKYNYDKGGNRIKREIVIEKISPRKQNSRGADFSETLNEKDIRLYPNPTDGFLKVEILGFDSNKDEGKMSIYDISGRCLFNFDIDSSDCNIDIVSQPKGIYMLNIVVNGVATTWKIIKK